MKIDIDPLVPQIIDLAGGPKVLADALGITRQACSGWKRIPVDHVLKIEKLIERRFTRYQMRPDIYPFKS